jgi:hypothetical protein
LIKIFNWKWNLFPDKLIFIYLKKHFWFLRNSPMENKFWTEFSKEFVFILDDFSLQLFVLFLYLSTVLFTFNYYL